jgi:hypothetical protein
MRGIAARYCRRSVAAGCCLLPMCFHQARIDATAKSGVSRFDTQIHKPGARPDVVDAVRDRFAAFRVDEVVDPVSWLISNP